MFGLTIFRKLRKLS